ncbi:flagellar hook-basal body complex protein [Litorimonas sp.]|jgi:flagellar basal-body rod protein FlgF|uniref:flagellar hook-basal body complex protein n=1 Tax=Litorimonas sp. TaxID=1892381 RepID=UPI003A8BD79C
MDNASYVNISRQSGLMKELNAIANNIANANTIGYKQEGAVFSEYVAAIGSAGSADAARHSLSMGRLAGHASNFTDGEMRSTGGSLDLAIQGEGFFLVDVDGQTRLTRAGHFMTDAAGTLINPDGNPVLDAGEGQIQIPLEADEIIIAPDGSISAGGIELGRLGIVTADQTQLSRAGGNNWISEGGFEPMETGRVLQGYLEDSNVEPVSEIARMIEVQRHYDAGQKLLEMEDERVKQTITTIRQVS